MAKRSNIGSSIGGGASGRRARGPSRGHPRGGSGTSRRTASQRAADGAVDLDGLEGVGRAASARSGTATAAGRRHGAGSPRTAACRRAPGRTSAHRRHRPRRQGAAARSAAARRRTAVAAVGAGDDQVGPAGAGRRLAASAARSRRRTRLRTTAVPTGRPTANATRSGGVVGRRCQVTGSARADRLPGARSAANCRRGADPPDACAPVARCAARSGRQAGAALAAGGRG